VKSFYPVCALFGALLLSGCGSVSLMSYDEPLVELREDGVSTQEAEAVRVELPARRAAIPKLDAPMIPTLRALESEIATWMGVPYKWGGENRNGVDCSAFVQNVLSDALDVAIPRTTALQKSIGIRVTPAALEVGDLVFFFTPKKTNHVGLYLGDGDFAHASTSRGVMVSNLSQSYWKNAFTIARRPDGLPPAGITMESDAHAEWALPPGSVQPERSTEPKEPRRSTRVRRTGW
jgi:NlpC/P60 family